MSVFSTLQSALDMWFAGHVVPLLRPSQSRQSNPNPATTTNLEEPLDSEGLLALHQAWALYQVGGPVPAGWALIPAGGPFTRWGYRGRDRGTEADGWMDTEGAWRLEPDHRGVDYFGDGRWTREEGGSSWRGI